MMANLRALTMLGGAALAAVGLTSCLSDVNSAAKHAARVQEERAEREEKLKKANSFESKMLTFELEKELDEKYGISQSKKSSLPPLTEEFLGDTLVYKSKLDSVAFHKEKNFAWEMYKMGRDRVWKEAEKLLNDKSLNYNEYKWRHDFLQAESEDNSLSLYDRMQRTMKEHCKE